MSLRNLVRLVNGVGGYREFKCNGGCLGLLRVMGVNADEAVVYVTPGLARVIINNVEVIISNGRLIVKRNGSVLIDYAVRRDASLLDPCGVVIAPVARHECRSLINGIEDTVSAGLIILERVLNPTQ